MKELSQAFGARTASRLWRTYGALGRDLAAGAGQNSELGQKVGPSSDLIVGELIHAIEREHAQSLIDLLQRRTMAGVRADLGRRTAPQAADWLVRLGFWDKARASEETEAYRRFLRRYAVPGPQEGLA